MHTTLIRCDCVTLCEDMLSRTDLLRIKTLDSRHYCRLSQYLLLYSRSRKEKRNFSLSRCFKTLPHYDDSLRAAGVHLLSSFHFAEGKAVDTKKRIEMWSESSGLEGASSIGGNQPKAFGWQHPKKTTCTNENI